MRILIIEHDHLSPPGHVAERFIDRGYDVVEHLVVPGDRYYSPDVTTEFPDPLDFDAIVPMGSPWGAWEDERIGTWLHPEMDLMRTADTAGIPVLGICFGGQLLARTHGGSVSRAPVPEIGWTAIMTDEPDIVSAGPWFSFHYDRWQLPPGAREIARTTRASQAFLLRRNLAVQFHPEITYSGLQGWMTQDGRDLVTADGQDPDIMLEQTRVEEPTARKRAHALVDAFLDQVAGTA